MRIIVIALILIASIPARAAIPGVDAFSTNNFKWNGQKMSLQSTQALGQLGLTNGGLRVASPPGVPSYVAMSQADITGVLIDPRNYGVTNWDGVHDDYPGLTNALAVAATFGGTLVLPSGTGVISQTITFPSRTYIRGANPVDITYKGNSPRQSIIKTSGAFSAFQTPRLTFPNDNFPFWSSDIDLENFYVMGPYTKATAVPGTVGLDLTGVRNIRLVNMHVEGFGTGILTRNTSELKCFGTFAQNNYYGIMPSRERYNGNVYDFLGHFYDTMSINNVVDIQLDNPRSVWFYGLERINLSTNSTAPFQIVNCEQDTHITIDGMIHENQSTVVPRITFDDNGFGSLRLLSCNSAVDLNQPIVQGTGYFDLIEITGHQFERGIVTNNHAPIVWAQQTAATNNQYIRQNRIVLKNNTPAWYDIFVRNDQNGSRPENDYVPDGYVNLNPFPNTDHANDGTIQLAGSPNYNTNNVMCGTSRIWWDTTTTNNFYELNTLTNLTRGIDHVYVTAVVYDLNGTAPPSIAVAGWGTQDVGWKIASQGRIGSYTNSNNDVFGKWAWCIALENPTNAVSGLTQVQLGSIYSPGGPGATNTGLERFCVYAPTQKNPYGPRKLTHSAIPSTGLEGWHNPGDFYFNDMTITTNVLGWLCVKYGLPGVWDTIPLGSFGGANQYKVLVDSSDTGATFLGGKLVQGSNITLTTNNPGGVETITIAASATGGGQPAFNSLTNYSLYWTNFTVITENFANLTNWLQEGTGTNFVASGNALHITGDTNAYMNYLSYTNWYTAADNWTMTCHAKFLTTNTATSFGLGLGLRGANPNADNNVWIQYDTANGAMYLFNAWAGSTNAPTAVNGTVASETWPSGQTNDFYYIELKKRGWTLKTTISNETSGAWQLYAHTFDPGSTNWGLMPYTSKPAIWAAGGSQVVSNFTFTVSGTFPCQLLMIGDSITQGYYTTAGNDTVFAKVKREVPSAGLLAAAADTTATILLRTNEINLFKPKDVILNVGVNDIGFGVATATWQTNLINLYNGITATGTKWVVRPSPISNADDTPVSDFVRLNWPANNIDLYNAVKTNSTFRLRAIYAYTDGIHLSSTGQCVYADLILNKVREGLK